MNSADVREHIMQQAASLLLGPMQQDEALTSNPSDTYLTGILWPKGTNADAASDEPAATEVDSGDATVDAPVPGYRAIRPCSFGLTCTVAAGALVAVDLGGTARYEPQELPESGGEEELAADDANGDVPTDGRPPIRWQRQPLGYAFAIDPGERRTHWVQNRFLLADGSEREDPDLGVDIRRRPDGERIVLTATLINQAPETEQGDRLLDRLLLFQTCLRISARHADNSGAILPRVSVPLADDEDALTNLLLYRDVQEFAIGHGIGAEWPAPSEGRITCASTSWMPRAVVVGTSPRGHTSLATLGSLITDPFSAECLGDEYARDPICETLTSFCNAYGRWIDNSLVERLEDFDDEMHRAAVVNLTRCRSTLARMKRGVATLEQSDSAWAAFALANQAMDAQSRLPSKGEQARPLIWRPFQLAFFLLVLPSVVDGEDPDRRTMDLLWFPTGGGKTEAYLGLTAFQIFLRRLQHAERRKAGGVDVLMRYTLRLLTVQQFQRAAALICACDALRKTNKARLGAAPISLGLYVGDKSTPNRLETAESRLGEELKGEKPPSTPRQLLICPVCGGKLPAAAYSMSPAKDRVEIRCPATGCTTKGKPLPVMTVDEELYRHPPSLLIGTIDKFAQLPRRTDIRTLFGLDEDLRPGLIIQDELHLISGPLGSMTGLYEAAVDLLCTQDRIPPKIIGSTATIGRARRQVRALYDRDVLQFPPPGFDAADSFFAVRDDVGPDRTYLGISTAGRSPKFALQALMAALLQAVDALRQSGAADDSALDAYWTCVGYFNSLRELGGAHVLMQDDVPRQMQFLAHRLGVDVARITAPPQELSSRVASREIPQALARLDQALDSKDPFAAEPVDSVLASNMISVGVDIPRLGLMVVNGQPKSTAEYIQATSRVGRRQPGLVITLYNFGRPRDLSHFEHFLDYHGALYRGVEATSVTPWAPRARDKALHAVLIALIRHLVDGLLDDEAALDFSEGQEETDAIVDFLVARAKAASCGLESEDTEQDLRNVIRTWTLRAQEYGIAKGGRLRYWEKKAPFGNTAPHLMRASEQLRSQNNPAWATPNSMRDVEPSTAFVLKCVRLTGGGNHGTTS
ncbi:MAG: helicase-related protein [Lamprobacter sp.]|uniref:helicase-related protein n=1 Tax=Lamprobacter sp. TaxID=3100796 RepID=UPI002B25A03A|nr:helicase-related protein [Lamprobacter sp.]MEA3640225.1 helicase-related protein [Lamprobacter sp.]